MAEWDSVSFKGENRTRITELIKIVDYRKNAKFKNYRYLGKLTKYAVVWLPIFKDGKPVTSQSTGKPINIPFNVTNFDPETETFDKTRECPFVEASEKIRKYIKDDKIAKQYLPQTGHYAQAINRDLQENPDKKGKPSKTEKASGVKDSLDSDAYTPIEVHQLNYTIGQGLESIMETNYKKDKETGDKVFYNCAHPKYGVDVLIKYDDKEKGQGKYKVQKGERTPLNGGDYPDETKYLFWDVVSALKETTMSRKEAKIEAERLVNEFMKSVKGSKKSGGDDDSPDDDDMPDDIEEALDKKKKSSKKSSKKDSPDDDDSPDADSPDADDDDDNSPVSPIEDDSPVEKKKSSKKSSSKSSSKKSSKKDSPDDEDSPDAEDEDSPVEKKKSNKSSKTSSKKTRKKISKKDSPDDEDDDDDSIIDLDDEDEDDDDD